MNLLDIFEGREPYQQAIDKLEQRRIEDLEAKMDDYAKRGMKNEFQKCKAERDSYFKIKTNEGAMKRQMESDAERMSRKQFCDKYGDEHGDFWDNINGPMDEAGIPGNVPVEKIPGKEDLLKGRGRSYYEATGDDKFDAMMGRIGNDPWTQLNSDPNWLYEIEELVDQQIEPWLLAMEKSGMPITQDNETLNPGWRKRYEQVANKLAQQFLTSRGLNPRDPDLVGKIRYAMDDLTDQSRNVHGQLSAYSDLPLQRYADAFDADGQTANMRDAMVGFIRTDDDDDDEPPTRPMPDNDPRRLDPGNMEEAKWDPLTYGDFPDEPSDDDERAEQLKAIRQYYNNNTLVTLALDDLYRIAMGTSYYDSVVRPEKYLGTIQNQRTGKTEKRYFKSKADAYSAAKRQNAVLVNLEKIDNQEDTSDLITLPVMLGVGDDKKKWMLKFPSEDYAQKWQFKHRQAAQIQWPAGHGLAEDAQDSKSWMTQTRAKYPDAKFMQAKMPGAPIRAYVNGKVVAEFNTDQKKNSALGEKKLGQLRPTLGTGHDVGRSVKKFRAQRGLDEYISMGSDKNYIEAEPYKNYRIYVRKKPFGTPGMYTAHTEIDRKEFKEPGASQEEAVQAIRDRIDSLLNAQKKVTGSSTIDFNVKFATDLLADPRQTFYAKLEKINGEPKLVIASADIASDPELLAAGDFKRSALRNQPDEQGRATPLPGIPLTAKGLRSGDWIAHGRYTVGNETQDRDGNRVFDLTYHSTAHTKDDNRRLNQPAFTLGTAREVDEEKNTGPLDQKLQRLKVQARRQFPRAHTDDEALVLKLLDKETQDDRLNRQTDARQDAELRKNFALDRDQEDEIEDLQTQVGVKEHGGGIGPKQRWQDLMPEQYNDDDYADEEETDLRSGNYVRDRQDGESGEIFRMQGDPYERRVRILDRDGRGWYIEPSRLTRVDPQDPDVQRYFGKQRQRDMDESANPKLDQLIKMIQAGKITAASLKDPALRPRLTQLVQQADPQADIAQLVATYAPATQVKATNVNDLKAQARSGNVMAQLPKTSAGTPSYAQRHATFEQGVAETATDVQAGMARIYHRLAPKIERYKDSFLAGQLYDELENYAELHGAETEFKRMMNGARNRAHMEYDTNPGGFQNWFWFLPFADEDVAEMDKSQKPPSRHGDYPLGAKGTTAKPTTPKKVVKSLTKDFEKAFAKEKGVEEGWSDRALAQRTGRPRTPYSVYINGKKWKDFADDDHAQAVANKLRAKFKAEGRDPSVITIAPTDYDQPIKEEQDTSAVESAIIRRIMVAHTDLLMKFGPEKVMQAAEEVAYNVGDVDEIGTSDVSAYVNQVRQILGAVSESKLEEKWSAKYKSSINCAKPKGFSQRAHCAGKKK